MGETGGFRGSRQHDMGSSHGQDVDGGTGGAFGCASRLGGLKPKAQHGAHIPVYTSTVMYLKETGPMVRVGSVKPTWQAIRTLFGPLAFFYSPGAARDFPDAGPRP